MDVRMKYRTGGEEMQSRIISTFLAMIPGIIGLCLLVAAIATSSWLAISNVTSTSFQVLTYGLFSVCKNQVNNLATSATSTIFCNTREEEAVGIDVLEQATRSLMIISVILHLPGIIAAIYFGLRKNIRRNSAIIPGVIFLVAALCAISGMGCYSAFMSNQSSAIGPNSAAYRNAEPGMSFFLGWFGTVCAVISCVVAFVSHAIN
ncbi:uncharacterized protein LOC120345898 [Styela clava]